MLNLFADAATCNNCKTILEIHGVKVKAFVEKNDITTLFFEKPFYCPNCGKKAESLSVLTESITDIDKPDSDQWVKGNIS